jgi:hypothetical protein
MSLVFGIVGILRDKPRTLAIVVAILALVACVLFFLGPLLSC